MWSEGKFPPTALMGEIFICQFFKIVHSVNDCIEPIIIMDLCKWCFCKLMLGSWVGWKLIYIIYKTSTAVIMDVRIRDVIWSQYKNKSTMVTTVTWPEVSISNFENSVQLCNLSLRPDTKLFLHPCVGCIILCNDAIKSLMVMCMQRHNAVICNIIGCSSIKQWVLGVYHG